MSRPLSKLNANQISEVWVSFLKDCSSHGDDVIYEEVKTTGGTWDPVKDRMVGGGSETVTQTYLRASLEAPVNFNEGATKGSGTGFVMGHQLGGIVAGETLITRLKIEVPLTQTGTYQIQGQRWKLVRLVDSYRVGKRVFWNLVHLAKA